MNKTRLIQQTLQIIKQYQTRFTPKERFQHMIEQGLVDAQGNVLVGQNEYKPTTTHVNEDRNKGTGKGQLGKNRKRKMTDHLKEWWRYVKRNWWR